MSTVSLASSAADSDALETIERHHAELVGGLSARTAALLTAVRRGEGWEDAREALVMWCRAELLPHAEAEEAVLYPAASELSALEPLVRAMSHEFASAGINRHGRLSQNAGGEGERLAFREGMGRGPGAGA